MSYEIKTCDFVEIEQCDIEKQSFKIEMCFISNWVEDFLRDILKNKRETHTHTHSPNYISIKFIALYPINKYARSNQVSILINNKFKYIQITIKSLNFKP